ncbi:MAG: ABC transporter ATP-binding protein [Conexivisphaerales archaeon]
MLQVEGLTKVYSARSGPAIQDVTFDVKDGEVVGFVGLNGAGKSTTIRIAAGIILPTRGTVSVDGHDILRDKVEASKRLGWVPELPNFELNAKALDLMKYYAGYYGIETAKAEKLSLELLKETGLGGYERKKLSSYSQGMKKRFALAASLLSDPQNFLFDEILNGLDPEGILFFRNLIVEMRKKGKAILLSSHILSEVQELSDRVVFIHKGKVVRVATREELASVEGGFLLLKIDALDEKAVRYLNNYGKVEVENDKVTVSEFKGDPSLINAELIRMGYSVKEISYRTPSLEDYFFKLIQEVDKE